MLNRVGDRTPPCGTPLFVSLLGFGIGTLLANFHV